MRKRVSVKVAEMKRAGEKKSAMLFSREKRSIPFAAKEQVP